MILSKQILIHILEDIIDRVKNNDSYQGNISYDFIGDQDMDADQAEIKACYRFGNLNGQGNMRLIE